MRRRVRINDVADKRDSHRPLLRTRVNADDPRSLATAEDDATFARDGGYLRGWLKGPVKVLSR